MAAAIPKLANRIDMIALDSCGSSSSAEVETKGVGFGGGVGLGARPDDDSKSDVGTDASGVAADAGSVLGAGASESQDGALSSSAMVQFDSDRCRFWLYL